MQTVLVKNRVLAIVLAIAVMANATLYASLKRTPVPLPGRADSLFGFFDNLPRVFTSNWTASHSGIRSSGIAAVSGNVSVKTLSSKDSVPLTADYVPAQGDMIVSSGDGSAVLTLDSDKEIFIDANTVLELADVKTDSNTNGYVTRLMLHQGNVLSSVHQPLGEHDIYEVRTPMLDMAIRGTTVHVGYDKTAENSTVAFLTGRGLIRSSDTGEVIDLVAGEQIVQNVDGYVKGDVDRDLLPAYIASSLNNFDEIMHEIDTNDYRATYVDNGFNADNYTFEQDETVVDEAKAAETAEVAQADEEPQPSVIQTLLENLGFDFGDDDNSNDNGNRSQKPNPSYSINIQSKLISFGSLQEEYALPAAQTLEIENTSNRAISLFQPKSNNYDIVALSNLTVNPGDTASFSIQPKPDLPAGEYKEVIGIKGSNGISDNVTVQFWVKAVPVIQAETLPVATVNVEYNHQLTATKEPTSWSSLGNLPAGLSLNDSGVISGLPTEAGEFTFSVIARNADGISKATAFSITIKEATPVDEFVKVTGITDVTKVIGVNQPLTLDGTVTPSNATNTTIEWIYLSATAGAEANLVGNILTVTSAGNNEKSVVKVKAKIKNGEGPGKDFESDPINIAITTDPLQCDDCGQDECVCLVQEVCIECGEVECVCLVQEVCIECGEVECVCLVQKVCSECGEVECVCLVQEVCSECGEVECTSACTCEACEPPTADGEYTITIETRGKGSVHSNHGTAEPGKKINLTPKADKDHEFIKWEIIKGDISIGNNNQFTMPAGNVVIIAWFTDDGEVSFTPLTVQIDDTGKTPETEDLEEMTDPVDPIDITQDDESGDDDETDDDETGGDETDDDETDGDETDGDDDSDDAPESDNTPPVLDVSEPESQE